MAAGVVTSFARPAGRIGDLALLAGFVWFAPFWAGWKGGPPLVLSLGTLAAGFAFPLLLHLVLAYPSGRLRSKGARALVVAVYLEAALSALGRALFRDPFFDPSCWDNCTDNVFLVRSLPRVARGIQDADLWFAAAAAAALATVCVWRLAAASAPARRTLWPVLAGGIALAAATIAHSVALTRMPLEDPSDPAFLSIFVVGCAAVIVLALGLTVGRSRRPSPAALRRPDRRRARRGAASRLARVRPRQGDRRSRAPNRLLAARPRDATSTVAADPVEEPVAASGRAVTPLVRDGRRVALVAHAAAVAELEREIGAAVRLALENERLQAEVLAQLQDLRASRTRIVETGDAERRRLERDLHDGAQQRLLALSYDLRLARAGCSRPTATSRAASLLDAQATDERRPPSDELRELAHGIYPAILTEAGLGARARDARRRRRRSPVEIGETARRALPGPGRDGGLPRRRRGDRRRGAEGRELRSPSARLRARRAPRGHGGGRRLGAQLHD